MARSPKEVQHERRKKGFKLVVRTKEMLTSLLPRSVIPNTEEEPSHLVRMLKGKDFGWKPGALVKISFFLAPQYPNHTWGTGFGLGRKEGTKEEDSSSSVHVKGAFTCLPGSATSMFHAPPWDCHIKVQPTYKILQGTNSSLNDR